MKERIITGILGMAGLLFLLWLGGMPYAVLILLVAALGFYEYLKMNKTKMLSFEGIIGMIGVLLIIYTYNFYNDVNIYGIFVCLAVLYLLLIVFKKNSITFDNAGYYLLGIIYIGLSFACMLETRFIENGLSITLFILVITWTSDSGAFFIGKKFGKKKLLPEISPKKTIAGSLGGIFFSIIAGLILNYFLKINTDWLFVVFVAGLISIVGQLGDLIESALKRTKGIKDSGSILPGHGGILDRFDSLMLIFLVLYIIRIFNI